MTKHITRFLIILMISCPFLLKAQSVGNYTTARTTGITYNSIISTGNSFAGWRYTGFFSEDDNRSEPTDIGFDFWYNGTRYTEFSASTNGFLDFSSSTDDGGPQCDDYGYCNFRYTSSSATSGTWLALAPFYDDMTTSGGIDPLGSSIKYELSGSAPNRVLTVEWDGMAVYLNTTPDLNFQVKLYESTGQIEYLYETMNNGTKTFSYTIGINASVISTPPAVSELLTLQTANSNTFSNTAQNNLSTMPVANSQYTFTSPTPANPSGSLTFTSVTNTGMTLNWTDWATNEVGYVFYYSTDNINFYFHSQVVANSTSAAITGLLPGTTYYWRVYAVTEGTLSTALTGNQLTLPPRIVISVQRGRWNRNATWDCNCVPNGGDNVQIRDAHVVTLRSGSEVCNDLTIGEGTSGRLRIGNNSTARDLSINSNLVVNSGAQISTNTGSNTTHTINIAGNITNNGTFNMASDANSLCDVNFTKIDGDQTVSGTGSTNTFHTINIAKSIKSNTLEITSSTFNCDADALIFIDAGTFKFSSAGTNSFSLFNTARDIPNKGKVWMNSTNGTMVFNSTVNLGGELVIDAGIVNIGNASNESLLSKGGVLEINGGALNVAGRFGREDAEFISQFKMTGGTMTLPIISSTSTTRAPFVMDVTGSVFNMSGGTIIIEREGGSGANNLGFVNTGSISGTVSGGTLQIGNASTPVGQLMQINSTKEVGNLLLNSANATGRLLTNDLTVLSDVTLTAGILTLNNLDLSVGGNWTNNGGTHTPGTGTVTLNGSSTQTISHTTEENFYHLICSGSGSKLLATDIDVNGDLTINSPLDVGTTNDIKLGGNWANNSSFLQGAGLVTFDGTSAQSLSGNNTKFYNITLNNASGASIVSGNDSLIGTLTLTNGNFSTNNAFTLISDAAGTARIAEITGGSISGDITMQRYIDAGATDWRFLTSAVSSTDLADLSSTFITSGFPGSDFPDFPSVSNRFTSIYFYDETVSGTLDNGYVIPSGITDAIAIAIGEGVWVYSGDTITGTTPFMVDVVGPANTGSITLPMTYTNTGSTDDDGWNMVGNPYPSTIDWDDGSITKTGINGAVYIWNPDLGQFASYISGIGTNGGSRYIASSQAFWVQANASPTLTVTEACKSAVDASFLRKAVESPLIISVQNNFGSDQLAINFDNAATNGFDALYDAYKLGSVHKDLPSISSVMLDSLEFSINQLAIQEISIPIKLLVGKSGMHNFTVENISDFGNPSCLILEDLFTGSSYNLKTNPTFSINISDTTTVPRFLLHVGEQIDSTITIDANSLTANASSVNYQWLDCDKGFAPIIGETSRTFNATKSGNYAVALTSNLCNKVDTSLCYSVFALSEEENSTSGLGLTVYPNPSNAIITIEMNVQENQQRIDLQIYNNLGTLVYNTVETRATGVYSEQVDMSNLSKGIYYLKVRIGDNTETINKKILLQ